MNGKDVAIAVGWLLAAWHVMSFIKDAERWNFNLARYNAAPTAPNLVKLMVAEGVLISDLRWL